MHQLKRILKDLSMAKPCIVKSSTAIRAVLKKRFEQLGLSNVQVAIEAERFGQTNVKSETLSRYFKNNATNSLTQESIIYLAYRYGIPVSLTIGNPIIEKGKIAHELPEYDEHQCIKNLKEILGIQTVMSKKILGVKDAEKFRKSRVENGKAKS